MKTEVKTEQPSTLEEDDVLTRLVSVAPFVPVHSGGYVPLTSIPWVNHALIKEGLDFYEKWSSSLVVSCALSIFLGVVVKPISAVFFRVGSLHDSDQVYLRMLRTGAGVHKFYQVLLNPEESKRHFDLIRKMHAIGGTKKLKLYQDERPIPEILRAESQVPWKTELATALRRDFEAFKPSRVLTVEQQVALEKILNWDPAVAINQFNSVATAFTAFGAMWMSPERFGVKNKEREMRGFIHIWAIFSKWLGVEDEFNIFIEWDSKYEVVFEHLMHASFRTVDETVITLQDSYMKGHSKGVEFLGVTTYKGLLYYSLKMREGFRGKNLWGVMDWRDKLCVGFVTVFVWMLANVWGFMGVMNKVINMLNRYWIAGLSKDNQKNRLNNVF